MTIHVKFADAPTFAPRGHDGVVNRLLVGREAHGVDDVGVWYGEFAPGGHSELHVHEQETQVYVVLSGSFVAGGESDLRELGVHDTVVVPPGEPHLIRAGSEGGTVMVITTPSLR